VPEVAVGDPGRLRQILLNLAGNAVKFTKRGDVIVRVDLQEKSASLCGLHFQVSDTGIGIPEEKQGAIFDAFQQADTSTTRRYGGTGLGLTISSRLVELMGGKIWVESQPDKGSTFHFTAAFGAAEDAGHEGAGLAEAQSARVLVVEEHRDSREILEE